MFNTTIIQRGSDRLVPVTKTVHEHRAPTVESAKYMNELREQAKEAFLGELRFDLKAGFIDIKGLLVTFHRSDADQAIQIIVHNGKEALLRTSFNFHEISDSSVYPGSFIEKMFDSISSEITRQLLTNCQNDLEKGLSNMSFAL